MESVHTDPRVDIAEKDYFSLFYFDNKQKVRLSEGGTCKDMSNVSVSTYTRYYYTAHTHSLETRLMCSSNIIRQVVFVVSMPNVQGTVEKLVAQDLQP